MENQNYLDESNMIVINKVLYDYCDNRRFCDYFYDAYDIIELEIVRK